MKSFQELDVWKKGHALTLAIYRMTKEFPKDERFGLVSQLRRSAASIGANIAEGFGRRSTKDFIRYLEIAVGSLEETRNYLLLSRDLGYCDERQFESLRPQLDEVGRMLGGLSRSLRAKLLPQPS
ncbi:MAG: four helix bundle protein [Acidobacteria bacterium]|nr:four helix bundle protein [Acidobacteriota bacterium]